ncbi:MAG: adenylate/guanylate cyclase domain-containing protein [Armatimonadetes bacterium]|nr:adenylate/guanylate cyclase domain-containing protein [Armatimonadota bacterium]
MSRYLTENAFNARQKATVVCLALLGGLLFGWFTVQDKGPREALESGPRRFIQENASALRQLDTRIYRAWYELRNSDLNVQDLGPAYQEIVLVLIDEASLKSQKVFRALAERNLLDEDSQALFEGLEWVAEVEAAGLPTGESLEIPANLDRLRRTLEDSGFGPEESERRIELARLSPAERREMMELPWPIPRGAYRELIRRLERAGASTIALDILFLDRSHDAGQDALLAEALANPKVVLPYALGDYGDLLEPDYAHFRLTRGWTQEDFLRRTGFTQADDEADYLWLKLVHAARDFQGAPVVENGRARVDTFYGFPLAIVAHHREVSPEEALARLRLPSESVEFMQRTVQVVRGVINFAARGLEQTDRPMGEAEATEALEIGPGHFAVEQSTETYVGKTIPELLQSLTLEALLEIPEGELPTSFHRSGRFIALVGVSATAGEDRKTSILGPISGPEIVANGVVNLLLGNFLREPPLWLRFAMSAGAVLLVGLLGAFLNRKVAFAAILATVAALVGANYYAFVGRGFVAGGLLLPLVAPLVALVVTELTVAVHHFLVQRSNLLKVIQMFKEVCPVHDLAGLLGEGLQLGGRERELSILFSDLRGYTSFAEKLDSVTVLNTLNQYFGAVGHIFERYGGFVFDYQGDAQMVVFGLVPASQPNHALAACKAGAAMISTLDRMREQWLKAGQNIPQTGVGVCTGLVSFGVLGTEQHKQYVAIGDPTNTASRVQGKSAELNAPVLIAESTFLAAGPELRAVPLEKLHLKGKSEPLQVYGVDIPAMVEPEEL